MRLIRVMFVALLGMASAALAADAPPAGSQLLNPAVDAQGILQANDWSYLRGKDHDKICYRMRTYRVRKDLDRESVIRTQPEDAAFDPDYIVGYSTCQRAGKYGLKSTH